MDKCTVCGKYVTDIYMVYQHIWKQSGLKPEDECCLDCLPGKLGRELNMSDFTDSPANRQIIFGYRMGRRPFEAEKIPEMPSMEPEKHFHTESEM